MRKVFALLVGMYLPASAAHAQTWVHEGSAAPDFTKNALDATPAARTLSDYRGKVVVLFLLGCT